MTINAELLKQKEILEKQHNIINGLEKALSQLLIKDDCEDSCKDAELLKQNKSHISGIIDHHSDLILDNTYRLESILLRLDLERN